MDRTPVATPAALDPGSTNGSAVVSSSPTVQPNESPTMVLPSGTTLTVRTGADGEDIVLRSTRGSMELRLRMTDDGPVLRLSGIRLEIEAAESVAVNCREFEVNARDTLRMSAGEVDVRSNTEVHVRSAGQTYIDGDYVNLNCLDRTGYHDHVPEDAAHPPVREGE